jgi:DNA ligase-1
MNKAFVTLYRKGSKDALQRWDLRVMLNDAGLPIIVTEHGQYGGKMQTAVEEVKVGKNVGKANETSVWDQAVAQAQSKWTLQKTKKGYVETEAEAMAGQVDALVEGGIFPMLAAKFKDFSDRVEYPAYIQPKFDGHRCIGVVKNGVATLWSRTRKPINSMPHVEKALVALSRGQDAIFDGELYNHDYRANFDQITKFIRPKAPVEGHEKVQLYVYDMPSIEEDFQTRNTVLTALFAAVDDESLKALHMVETYPIDAEDEAVLAFDKFFSEGYEGAMLRTRDNMYLQHPTSRSKGLLKMKKFEDAEFEIVDVVEGKGKFAGLAKFICRAGNGELFEAVKNGPLSELKEYYDNRAELIGRIITVQFMGFTNARGVPRHGRAIRFREDL